MADPPTLVDRIVTRAKNHRVLGVLILVGIVVISLGKFVGAIKPIIDLFREKSTTTTQQAKSPEVVPLPGNSLATSASSAVTKVSTVPEKVFNEAFEPCDVTFSPKGHLFAYITTSGTGVVKIFGVDNWELIKQLANDEDKSGAPWFTALAFSPDGRWLAAGTVHNGIILYNTGDWSVRSHFGGDHVEIDSIAFSPDGGILVFAEGRYDSAQNAEYETIKVSGIDGTPIRTVADLRVWIGPITFSHDGKRIAAKAYDGTVRIWDVAGNSPPLTFPVTGTGGPNVVFNHDDTWLASGSNDGTIKLWSTVNGELLQTLSWRPSPTPDQGTQKVVVNYLAMSPDGRRLAANENETIALWDAVTGSLLENYVYHTNKEYAQLVNALAFSSDGHFLAESNAHTNLVIVWRVN